MKARRMSRIFGGAARYQSAHLQAERDF